MAEKSRYVAALGLSMAFTASGLSGEHQDARQYQPNPDQQLFAERPSTDDVLTSGMPSRMVFDSVTIELLLPHPDPVPPEILIPYEEPAEVIIPPKPELDLSFLNQKSEKASIKEAPTWRQEVRFQAANAKPVPGDLASWIAQSRISNPEIATIIFGRESGGRPNAINPGDCNGFGQNCPTKDGKYFLLEACPNWVEDVICQLDRWEDYAIGKYKTWDDALDWWDANHSW